MIDTHAHLTSRFCDVTEEVIKKISKSNISKVVLAASNIEDSKENILFTKRYPDIFKSAIGIHPQDTMPTVKISIDEQIDFLDSMALNNKNSVIAIGECGLDFSPPPPEEKERSRSEQEYLFKQQIGLAIKHQLPLIIHARKAVDETIAILSEYKNLKGVFHCYAGGKKRINQILDLSENWFFGIDGNITYEDGLQEVVKAIPKERLILETDSPFLTPEPHKGEVNNPTYVKFIYDKIADIWGLPQNDTEKLIDKNAKSLFAL